MGQLTGWLCLNVLNESQQISEPLDRAPPMDLSSSHLISSHLFSVDSASLVLRRVDEPKMVWRFRIA